MNKDFRQYFTPKSILPTSIKSCDKIHDPTCETKKIKKQTNSTEDHEEHFTPRKKMKYSSDHLDESSSYQDISNSDKKLGQYFTPREVIRCMVDLIEPNVNLDKVSESSYGSGSFIDTLNKFK